MKPLLGADIELWIKLAFFILVFGVSGISQVIKALRKARPPAGPGPMAGAGRPQARPGQQELVDEVEEFLRRAANQGQANPQAPRAERAAPRRAPLDPERGPFAAGQPAVAKSIQRQERKRAAKKTPANVEVVTAQVVEEPLTKRHLAPGLQDHISGRNLEKRSGSLTQHEEQFSTKIEESFRHSVSGLASKLEDVSSIGDQAQAAASATATPLVDVMALIGNPENVRQAVVLNEILTRPEHRW